MQPVNNKRGHQPKTRNFNELTNILYEQGYNFHSICSQLEITPRYYFNYFLKPNAFTLERLKSISWMSGKPLPYVINLCLKLSPSSVHWFDEGSISTEAVVEGVKRAKMVK